MSKMLVPALLALLAAVVLTLFSEIERELRLRLQDESAFTMIGNEFVPADKAPTLLGKSYQEEAMWTNRYGPEKFKQVRQPLISAMLGRAQSVPVFVYGPSLSDFDDGNLGETPPAIRLLTMDSSYHGQTQDVLLGNRRTYAKGEPLPTWMGKELSLSIAVFVPAGLMENFMQKGFVIHTVARMGGMAQLEEYSNESKAYYRAEKRQVRFTSVLEVLRNLEKIESLQRLVRTLIVGGCGIILALTLGSVSWLEYRQDAYLIALLRSFGVPPWMLFLHMFMENLLLVLLGIGAILLAWKPLYEVAMPYLAQLGMRSTQLPNISWADFGIMLLAGVVGVVFAMMPVAFGMRKPPGLILQ